MAADHLRPAARAGPCARRARRRHRPGLIDPLNGEGIQYALRSGRWAAATILDALAAGELSAARLRPYQRRVADELRYDMALAGTIVELIRNRALAPLWLAALEVNVARAKHDPSGRSRCSRLCPSAAAPGARRRRAETGAAPPGTVPPTGARRRRG
ncbi:MAG: hypothetical protein QM733_04145 [Ilumatobacteraceae bacterium]